MFYYIKILVIILYKNSMRAAWTLLLVLVMVIHVVQFYRDKLQKQ